MFRYLIFFSLFVVSACSSTYQTGSNSENSSTQNSGAIWQPGDPVPDDLLGYLEENGFELWMIGFADAPMETPPSRPALRVAGSSCSCGDINGDNFVNASDIFALVNALFFTFESLENEECVDTSGNGGIDLADITALVLYVYYDGSLNCPSNGGDFTRQSCQAPVGASGIVGPTPSTPPADAVRISGCVGTLNQNNTYYLLDFSGQTVSSQSNCLNLAADNSVLDLNGKTVVFDTNAQGNSTGIRLSGSNSEIRNGRIAQSTNCGLQECSGDIALDIGSGTLNSKVRHLEITVHGYDTHGIYAAGPSADCRDGILEVSNNRIFHNGEYISSRDGFTSEPAKFSRYNQKFHFHNNEILSSPHAGIFLANYSWTESGNGCQDGTIIEHNTIRIDNALYANPNGIHGYQVPAVQVSCNLLDGRGMDGIQLDSAEVQYGTHRTQIFGNHIDVDTNYWPRGHSAGAGALQGIRIRYGTEYMDIYDNFVRVNADSAQDQLETNSAVGMWITCSRYNDSTGEVVDGCLDVNIVDNVVEAVADGTASSAHAMNLDGLEPSRTSNVLISGNILRSNNVILQWGMTVTQKMGQVEL